MPTSEEVLFSEPLWSFVEDPCILIKKSYANSARDGLDSLRARNDRGFSLCAASVGK